MTKQDWFRSVSKTAQGGLVQAPADISNHIENGNLPTQKWTFLPNHAISIRVIGLKIDELFWWEYVRLG